MTEDKSVNDETEIGGARRALADTDPGFLVDPELLNAIGVDDEDEARELLARMKRPPPVRINPQRFVDEDGTVYEGEGDITMADLLLMDELDSFTLID